MDSSIFPYRYYTLAVLTSVTAALLLDAQILIAVIFSFSTSFSAELRWGCDHGAEAWSVVEQNGHS